MRDQFHEDLDTITDQLVELTRLAGSAISRATTALTSSWSPRSAATSTSMPG